jgi:hypothetical protein
MRLFDRGVPGSGRRASTAQQRGGATVVAFPGRNEMRMRRVAAALRSALDELDLGSVCTLEPDLRAGRLWIDRHAGIDLCPTTPDLAFVLCMASGEQVLLKTDDTGMMTDFVLQYVHARLNDHAVLRECL